MFNQKNEKKMRKECFSLIAIAILLIASSCTNNHEPVIDLNAAKYYTTDIKPIFVKAGCTACHDGTYSGGVSILVNSESYADVMKTWVDNKVDSKLTKLFLSLNPTSSTDPKMNMRINPAVSITQSQVDVINAWLKAGAPEKP
jgi:hypothetical protein